MPQTMEGLRTFLEYWLYGVVTSSSELGNAKVFLRKVQEESIRKFLETEGIRPGPNREPLQVLRTYLQALDERGIMDAADVASRKEGDRLKLEIGPLCPYRSTCNRVHSAGRAVLCFRAIALAEAIRLLGGPAFSGSLDVFGLPCRLTLTPERYGVA